MPYTRSSKSQPARKRLADLVLARMKELEMSEGDFMRSMGITSRLVLTRRLGGKANFRMEDCQRLAEVLSCDEREMLIMHLAQFHSQKVVEYLLAKLCSHGHTGSQSSRVRAVVYERLSCELSEA